MYRIYQEIVCGYGVNATFNNISVIISWLTFLLVEH